MLIGTTEHGTLSNAINNIGIGLNSLRAITGGQNNIAVGKDSLSSNNSGSTNTGIGTKTLENNTTGQGNVSIGNQSGTVNTTGQNNTFIGKYSDATSTYNNLSNATAIGYNAKVNTNNTIQLGNNAITNVKTSGNMTLGSVTYTNSAGTNGQFLKYDGAGNANWGDIDKTQIDYTTAYQQVTYQVSNSGNANYIGDNTHIKDALNSMSQALATLATAVQALNDKYVMD